MALLANSKRDKDGGPSAYCSHFAPFHGVRRLPVIDGHDLVGVVSQADLAANVEEAKVGRFVRATYLRPPS